jgi:uncharacterized cupin superfamily protein
MSTSNDRPSFIRNFSELLEPAPNWARNTDLDGQAARFGRRLGLTRLGINYEVVPPGHRTSLPHAHEKDEEFILVVRGEPDVWIDGVLHRLGPGDGVAFPPGTGIAHNILNNTDEPVHLLIVGDADAVSEGDHVFYPVDSFMEKHPVFWHDAPRRPLGPHDGRPKRRS